MLTRTGLLIGLALVALFLAGCSSGDVDPPECDRIRLSGPITLSDAAQYDCAATALALIEPAGSIPGVDVNASDENGNIPLVLAAEHNSINVARLLIENGAETEANSIREMGSYDYPLLAAVKHDSKDVAELLIENDTGWFDYGREFESLNTAISSNSLHMIKLLIENRINPNEQERDLGYWRRVVESNSLEIASMLIELGVDVNARDKNGMSALMIAVSEPRSSPRKPESLALIKLLLERGAEVNAKTPNARTPLHIAITRIDVSVELLVSSYDSSDAALVKMLLEAGADVNAMAEEGKSKTPIIGAARGNFADVATLLIEAGAEVNLKGEDKKPPLWWALRACYVPISNLDCSGERGAVARILLANGAEYEPFGIEKDWLNDAVDSLR